MGLCPTLSSKIDVDTFYILQSLEFVHGMQLKYLITFLLANDMLIALLGIGHVTAILRKKHQFKKSTKSKDPFILIKNTFSRHNY